MNKHLYTTDEFGRSTDQSAKRVNTKKYTIKRKKANQYESFFDGYDAISVPKSNGKGEKIVRVYTGTLFRQEIAENQRKPLRLMYAVLFIFSVALFISAMLIPTASNSTWYVVLLAIIPGYFYARLLMALNLYLFSGQELKMYEYKAGAQKLIELPKHIVKTLLIPMVASAIALFLDAESFSMLELVRFLLFFVSAASAMGIGKIESMIKYTELSPRDKADIETE